MEISNLKMSFAGSAVFSYNQPQSFADGIHLVSFSQNRVWHF